ncbi:Zinc finger and BTB domain-containing protein like [Argiope bruennichi]|uniref:Zinc finger and BTB domain-containing protein like n=1 Tax=Argiope bruennichi TaxID=94029 RepID=A0A8T0EN09_ARGBR|nr:Zinc finger and BTB domain-containing protein like [Argiope bruennichi]
MFTKSSRRKALTYMVTSVQQSKVFQSEQKIIPLFLQSIVSNLSFRYKCSWCSYGTNIYSELKHHMYIHTGGKPFSCEICGKKFSHPTTLQMHVAIHVSLNEKAWGKFF